MALYDVFLSNSHSDRAKQLMIKNNERIVSYIVKRYFEETEKISFLEIGPGKGYLHTAILQNSKKIEYWAMDRNQAILDNLGIDGNHMIFGAVPECQISGKFDVIFCGYVIEHLENGVKLYETLSLLKEHLNPNGVIVLAFPNCMKLKMEFYNIDYTHILPTTKRNVNQCVIDVGCHVDKAVDLNGILYNKKVDSTFAYAVKKAVVSLYSYRICNFICKPFYHVPEWDLRNVFWRAYALIKEPNVVFFIRKTDEKNM